MNLSDLKNKRMIEEFKADKELVKTQLELARSKLRSANNILSIGEWESAHNNAYHAMLAAGRALMYDKGYRPMSQDHHVAVIMFTQIYAGKFGEDVIKAFDNARKKRNESFYDAGESISETQARSLVTKAESFVSKIVEMLNP